MEDLTVIEARTLLARAFVDDPLMVWFFPDDRSRVHACAALFGLFAEHYLAAGRVDVVRRPQPVALAMWQWPAAERESAEESLPSTSGLMSALMGADRAAGLGAEMAVLGNLRPSEPYAHLHLLGVDPDARCQGLGGQVLEQGLAAAREAGLVAALETMNPANVPFYEAHGLTVQREIQLGSGGPRVWAMATARAAP